MALMSISHTRNRSTRRGKASVELISYAAFFFLVFMAAVVIFFQMQSQEMYRAENANAQEIAYGFADQIRTAFVAGDGFGQSISIPTNILNKPYTLSITSAGTASTTPTGYVYVEWQGVNGQESVSAATMTTNYNATACTTSNPNAFICQNVSGRITINASQQHMVIMSNNNGTIIFTQG